MLQKLNKLQLNERSLKKKKNTKTPMSLSNNRKGTEFVFILKATVRKETFVKPEIPMTS